MQAIELIDFICNEYDKTGSVDCLQKLLDWNGASFNIEIAEAINDAIEARVEVCPQPITDWVVSLSGCLNILPRFLYARYLVRQGSYSEAIEMLQSLVNSSVKLDPLLLLHLVRLLVRIKRIPLAAKYLSLALSLDPPVSFFVKSERLLQKILESGEWQPRQGLKIALLGSSTTTFLASVIKASCFKIGIQADVYEAGYGNYQQDILNPASALYAFNPQAVILLLNQRDLALSPFVQPEMAKQIVSDLRNLWSVLQERNPCHLLQVGFDLPPYGPGGCLEDTTCGGRARVIREINLLLSEKLPSGVSYCDMDKISISMGEKFHSSIGWYSNKQYPALEALPLLSDHLVAHLRAAFGLASKVLVLDLDNTLWGGVIGEDGVNGILLGPSTPEGEGYLDLQQYAKELKERGVLLAVCSKNNCNDAELPFKKHESMILGLDDFVVFTANWVDKATNIKEMSQQLALGLNSFVFLDDNPLERDWVRSQIPEVIVPECGSKPWEMLAALRRGMYFESIASTAEDVTRHDSYKSNLVRQKLESAATTVEEFLMGLEMVANCGPVDSRTLARVTQLINKTNQFNLTTRRYTEEQVRGMSESKDWWTRWFSLKDKFGDHGLIGVLLAKKNNECWHVDTLLMSCRVLGRKMEEFMIEHLLRSVHQSGSIKVTGEYIPSLKNALVEDMYHKLGFVRGESANQFSLILEDASTSPTCEFICQDGQPPKTRKN